MLYLKLYGLTAVALFVLFSATDLIADRRYSLLYPGERFAMNVILTIVLSAGTVGVVWVAHTIIGVALPEGL